MGKTGFCKVKITVESPVSRSKMQFFIDDCEQAKDALAEISDLFKGCEEEKVIRVAQFNGTDIKRAIKARFGDVVTSVTRSRGTAYGWFTVKLKAEAKEMRDEVELFVVNTFEISTYISDDGYDTERSCLHVNVER